MCGRKTRRIIRVILSCVICLLSVYSNIAFSAGKSSTVDDVRELLGRTRVDETFTTEEKGVITANFMRVERHNIAAKMFELGSKLVLDYDIERINLLSTVDGYRATLLSDFRSGAAVSDVLYTKTKLSGVLSKVSKLRASGEDIKINFVPNTWTRQYDEVLRVLEEMDNRFILGEIGADLKSPVLNSFVITSPFGVTPDPFTEGATRMHLGIDLLARVGDIVLAQWNGVVSNVHTTHDGGLTVEIAHGREMRTRYLHLSEVFVKPGDKVQQYHVIGKVGDTGKVTGPHLHFEVSVDGIPVNPVMLFGQRGINALREFASRNPNERGDTLDVAQTIRQRPRNAGVGVEVPESEWGVKIPPGFRRQGLGDTDYRKEQTYLPADYVPPNPGIPNIEDLLRGR